jgi:hypothetical protein
VFSLSALKSLVQDEIKISGLAMPAREKSVHAAFSMTSIEILPPC